MAETETRNYTVSGRFRINVSGYNDDDDDDDESYGRQFPASPGAGGSPARGP